MNDKDSGSDAGPMLAYGDKALGLQKEIYDSQRADAQPWYQTGTSAVNQLSTLMGLKPSTTASSRQSLIDQYRPQFTSSTPGTVDPMDAANLAVLRDQRTRNPGDFGMDRLRELQTLEERVNSGSKPQSTTDMIGLNSYIDNLLAQQGNAAQNDPNFGKLAKSFSMEDYQADPGYAFRLAEGNKALERKLNASGKTYSPEAAKALMGYNQDMGSQEFGNAYNRFNINQDTLFNRLATLSGYGQTASGQIANAGANYANAGSDIYTGQGNAITAANQARQVNNSSMFNTLLGGAAQLGSAYMFSDERLKENIERVGEENGFPLYKFNYINIPEKTFIGVMAQDVEKIMPDAVSEVEGYKIVNYDMIGVKMREVVTCH